MIPALTYNEATLDSAFVKSATLTQFDLSQRNIFLLVIDVTLCWCIIYPICTVIF